MSGASVTFLKPDATASLPVLLRIHAMEVLLRYVRRTVDNQVKFDA
jgi:hypothetical protein